VELERNAIASLHYDPHARQDHSVGPLAEIASIVQ
jgi:hypothetical protein